MLHPVMPFCCAPMDFGNLCREGNEKAAAESKETRSVASGNGEIAADKNSGGYG